MKSLEKQIEAYEAMQDELEADHFREWVVFYDEELVGVYPSGPDAAEDARIKFGRGPYLIKQIAAPPAFIPSVLRVETRRAVNGSGRTSGDSVSSLDSPRVYFHGEDADRTRS